MSLHVPFLLHELTSHHSLTGFSAWLASELPRSHKLAPGVSSNPDVTTLLMNSVATVRTVACKVAEFGNNKPFYATI